MPRLPRTSVGARRPAAAAVAAKRQNEPEVGAVWDEQAAEPVAAKNGSGSEEEARVVVGTLPPEEQVSDPEEEIDPEEDYFGPYAGSTQESEPLPPDAPEESKALILHPSQEEEDEEGSAPEGAAAPGDVEPVVAVYAELISHVVRKSGAGRVFQLVFEVDSAAAAEFIELIGEQSFSAVLDKLTIATSGVRVDAVPTKAQDNEPHTKVTLDITEDQIPLSGLSCQFVSQTRLLQLYPTQLGLDLTTRAE